MTQDQNNSKGILYILLGMFLFSIQDALIKFVYEEVALYELYFGRTLTALILLTCYLNFSKQKIILKTHYPLLTVFRVICFFFGFSFFYISLTYMSLAMANALFFSSPFFVSILATIFLKEKVGIRRWSAIFIGFIGVYIVLNPDFNDFDFMKLAPVRALEFLSAGKFKATNHRVLWNKSKRLSIPFFFEPSYDFKMNRSFLNLKKSSSKSQIYEKFLNQSLKRFIEYQR